MARQAERRGISKEDYLSWERSQGVRHEYFKGEIFAMAGGSVRHNALCSRVNAIPHFYRREQSECGNFGGGWSRAILRSPWSGRPNC